MPRVTNKTLVSFLATSHSFDLSLSRYVEFAVLTLSSSSCVFNFPPWQALKPSSLRKVQIYLYIHGEVQHASIYAIGGSLFVSDEDEKKLIILLPATLSKEINGVFLVANQDLVQTHTYFSHILKDEKGGRGEQEGKKRGGGGGGGGGGRRGVRYPIIKVSEFDWTSGYRDPILSNQSRFLGKYYIISRKNNRRKIRLLNEHKGKLSNWDVWNALGHTDVLLWRIYVLRILFLTRFFRSFFQSSNWSHPSQLFASDTVIAEKNAERYDQPVEPLLLSLIAITSPYLPSPILWQAR